MPHMVEGGGERKLKDMLIRPENPHYDAAEARVHQLMERASVSEAMQVMDELEAEVRTMNIAERFNPEKLIGRAVEGFEASGIAPDKRHLTEAEYKREQLLANIRTLKGDLLRTIGGLETVVMDIEATKT